MTKLIRDIRRKARHMTFDSAIYGWSLGGAAPERLNAPGGDPWPGCAERGRLLDANVFATNGDRLPLRGTCWEPVGVSPAWLDHIHGFSWLRDLRAAGGDDTRRRAREMIESWISRHGRWALPAWRADLTGRRIANWIALFGFYGASASEDFQRRLFDSLARQARHLSRALPGDVTGLPLLHGIRGLALAGLAFAGQEAWLAQALDLLQAESRKQILPDGGHVSRSPAQLLEALRIFMDLRTGLRASGYPVPEPVEHTIDRMAQALRFFRYPDRGLALFNGSQEGDADIIDAALSRANAHGRVLRGLPQSGYERLTQGRSLLMIDAGGPPPWPYDTDAHAAPLSLEFIYGRERLFVSCGTHPLEDGWRTALRHTSAHNSLSIGAGDQWRDACGIGDDGHVSRRPRPVQFTREDSSDALLAEGAHDGYFALNGITHRRRFFLGRQGHDLRGEDTLTCSTGLGRETEFAVRFHLHPKAQAALVRDGREALVRLSGGAGWRFSCAGGHLALEDSLYLGSGSQPRRTQQLVIYGRMTKDSAQAKWALRRETATQD